MADISKYVTYIVPKYQRIKSFCSSQTCWLYKLGSKGTKGVMTIYYIGYVKVGKTLVLAGTIGVVGCG